MKKYPVKYKEKEYEVRWETLGIHIVLTIYEVKEIKIFNKIKIKRYIKKYSENLYNIRVLMTITSNDSNYYIETVKLLFELWEKNLIAQEERNKIEIAKKQALEEWDGVIDE